MDIKKIEDFERICELFYDSKCKTLELMCALENLAPDDQEAKLFSKLWEDAIKMFTQAEIHIYHTYTNEEIKEDKRESGNFFYVKSKYLELKGKPVKVNNDIGVLVGIGEDCQNYFYILEKPDGKRIWANTLSRIDLV